MPLLIEVEAVPEGPITLGVGDVVACSASGAVVDSGTAVGVLGAFVRALPGPGGRPLVPQGPPNVVLFRADRPGDAVLRIATSEPWGAGPGYTQIRVTVR